MTRRATVCAHRGASLELPDNSVEAFVAAIAGGCDVIETDVRLRADGTLVLAHDTWDIVEGVVELETLLELARGRVGLDLEIKEPAAAQAVCDAVQRWAGWLMITAFDPETLIAVRGHAPRVKTGLIIEAPVTVHPVLTAQRCGAGAILWEDELGHPDRPGCLRGQGTGLLGMDGQRAVPSRRTAGRGSRGRHH